MKKLLLTFFFVFVWFQSVNANTFIEKTVSGYKMRVVEYDILAPNYDLRFLKAPEQTEQSLDTILYNNNAISWVNGSFFCPSDYSFCSGKEGTTNNQRYFEGISYEWFEGSWDKPMFVLDKNKNSFIYQRNNLNTDKEGEIFDGLSNWPLLLKDGENQLEGYYDMGVIDAKMKANSTKNFICNSQDKTKIYFWLVYSIDIDTLASVLRDFWCSDALNLDAWLSTSLMYNWKYVVGPQRNIIDAVAIIPKFDIKPLEEKSKKISEYLLTRAENKSKWNEQRKQKILKNYISQLDELKSKIYDKYSTDIIEQNFVWETEKVGYKIEVTNDKFLKIIYMINKINYQLKL